MSRKDNWENHLRKKEGAGYVLRLRKPLTKKNKVNEFLTIKKEHKTLTGNILHICKYSWEWQKSGILFDTIT